MKLSKEQQKVVDKMRQGWVLYYGFSNDWLRKDGRQTFDVWRATTNSLLKRGVIEPIGGSFPAAYELTEKYRSNDSNS